MYVYVAIVKVVLQYASACTEQLRVAPLALVSSRLSRDVALFVRWLLYPGLLRTGLEDEETARTAGALNAVTHMYVCVCVYMQQ